MMTVFVTGASAGFGQAIATRFLKEGHRVVATARRLEPLQALADQFPGQVLPLQLDITDAKQIQERIAGLPGDFASIDVLVNNAGLALGLNAAQECDLADWDTMIATNCSGLVHVTRHVVSGMVERGSGSIINIGSVAGEFAYPGGNVYGATKAFVHQFSQGLNADLMGTGVRACCIEPGLCGGTEFSNVRFGDDKRAAAVYEGTQPLTADDIAETVYWVATQPKHVTINVISMMPNCQSFAPLKILRNTSGS